mmetsp:Transcript_45467/g.145923  ORF Transcript_45467/g.145923 Transcript_45467/m.145923 type:complete len:105 (-) Transcript_45467:116-430(-)
MNCTASGTKKQGETVPCHVRVGGECGDSGCAVALENVVKFGEEHSVGREMWYGFGYCIALLVGSCPILFFVLLLFAPRLQLDEQTGLLSEDEGSGGAAEGAAER